MSDDVYMGKIEVRAAQHLGILTINAKVHFHLRWESKKPLYRPGDTGVYVQGLVSRVVTLRCSG